ncbi:hypothetical protein [Leeia aquatica]|uniref:Uncharacterized protein n=1 Tax=Leeia aquatica TaxID=2725557 RepID=A0A847S6V3_9NEIS|nr:hypothetical protein [Leeia aquatica]NLR75624.1 hypothetical protein [Leeia aquatica]
MIRSLLALLSYGLPRLWAAAFLCSALINLLWPSHFLHPQQHCAVAYTISAGSDSASNVWTCQPYWWATRHWGEAFALKLVTLLDLLMAGLCWSLYHFRHRLRGDGA